jgi:hypothetical protein
MGWLYEKSLSKVIIRTGVLNVDLYDTNTVISGEIKSRKKAETTTDFKSLRRNRLSDF